MKKILLIALFYCLPASAVMKLISPAFSHNESIPTEYSCDGANISPALMWSDAPENTQSFALIVDDPDASNFAKATSDTPAKVWVHWVVFNIPSTVDHIDKNQGSSRAEAPFTYGSTDFGTQKWGGPCPPRGTHHYHFTLYALDTMLDAPAGATKEDILKAMHGHILEQTTLIGTYQRKNND